MAMILNFLRLPLCQLSNSVNYINESMGMNIPQKTYQYQIVTSVSNSTSIQRY